jgi:cyclic pyranopterin phosphate synthase
MKDRLGRPLRDLRVSVTDRCNMRCRYCMPREIFGPDFPFLPRGEILSFEEIARVVRAGARLGVRKVRLTGGEPLLRRGLPELVRMVSAVEGIEEVAMTTNGLLLERNVEALARAGLRRVTVSLDALDDEALHTINDAPVSAARILAGIESALDAGLSPVKINMTVRRGVNEGSAIAMAERFRRHEVVLRFIEYMDVGSTNNWAADEVVPSRELRERIESHWPLVPLPPTSEGEVASRYAYRDGAGEIGFIHSVTEPFCGGCTRARLSADGKLFTCLFASAGSDLRALLRGGASDEELERRLASVWGQRQDRYSAERHRTEAGAPRVEMSYIGG